MAFSSTCLAVDAAACSGGTWLEESAGMLTCGLGFLIAWHLAFKNKCPEREWGRWKQCFFYDLVLGTPLHHHLPCIFSVGHSCEDQLISVPGARNGTCLCRLSKLETAAPGLTCEKGLGRWEGEWEDESRCGGRQLNTTKWQGKCLITGKTGMV